MIIKQSNIQMSSEHHFSAATHEVVEGQASLFDLMFPQAGSAENAEPRTVPSLLVLTDEGYKFRETTADEQNTTLAEQYTASKLFAALYKALTGKEIPSTELPDADAGDTRGVVNDENGRVQFSEATRGLGVSFKVSMEVGVTQVYQEHESSQFQAGGVIQTADGRELAVGLSVSMSRSYESSSTYRETREIEFKDPLMLAFDGDGVELDDKRFEFDIDADGESDWLHYLTGNDGWLAYDRNGDGTINDGSELFGGLSGNGFQDLAAYDDDQNGFIDEADDIFSSLGIWQKTADVDQLTSLKDRDVGAIYLGSQQTPFTIKDGANETQARVARSGMYLTESGEAKAMHQVDMAV